VVVGSIVIGSMGVCITPVTHHKFLDEYFLNTGKENNNAERSTI
jgi:hypothetical protein